MKLSLYQVDAFAQHPFEGNPAAVVPLHEWLPDDLLLSIAAENNLSETAFFVKTEKGYHLRWFTPTVEIPLCGHATLASAFIIFNEIGYPEDVIVFETMSGDLSVEREENRFVLDFPSYEITATSVPEKLEEALGLEIQEFYFSEGSVFALVRVADENTVKNCVPDFALLQSIAPGNFIVTAPGSDHDFVSRVFVPEHGIPEDPVTGSAHCVSAPYWAAQLGKHTLLARQVSRRGGNILCQLQEDRLKMSGQAVLYLKGEISV